MIHHVCRGFLIECLESEACHLCWLSSVRETTVTGLPQPVIDFYENVVLPIEGEVTYHSLLDGYTEYYKRTISQVHLKYKFASPLVGTGLSLSRRTSCRWEKEGYKRKSHSCGSPSGNHHR